MIVWASLSAFLLIAPLVGLLVWNWMRRRDRKPSIQFSSLRVIKGISPGFRARLKWLPLFLKVVGIVLAIVALARPQRADTKIKRNVEGIDIMMALDISDSMLIEDMRPTNRLESSKKVIKDFVNQRISDRMGLVVFSGESYTRVPLTLDYPILLNNLKKVKTSRNIKMGTAIGVALANAVARLRESEAKTRIVILLTDGENNSGTIDPETALDIAKGYGMRIYTIGVGRDGQAKLPVFRKDLFNRTVKSYQPIHSKVNVTLLKRLASETGGKFYRATNTGTLERVFNDINKLERSKIDVSQYTKYAELYPPWLQLAFWFYLASIFVQHTILRRGP